MEQGKDAGKELEKKNKLVLYGTAFITIVVLIGLYLVYGQGNHSPSNNGWNDFPSELVGGRAVRGNASGKVQIVEFSDFECPFCAALAPNLDQILTNYPGKVSVMYRNFPLDTSCNSFMQTQVHPLACNAAEAFQCAVNQSAVLGWRMHDVMFDESRNAAQERRTPNLQVADLKNMAQKAGADTAKFNDCLDNARQDALIQQDIVEGYTNRGVQSTPTFFVNGDQYTGLKSYTELKNIVDKALNSS